MGHPTFKPVADRAVLIEFGTEVDDALNRQVVALDHSIAAAGISGVVETVPALVNLLVMFDPLITDHGQLETAIRRLFPIPEQDEGNAKTHVVPECYDTELCPDLTAVAKATGLSIDAVIAAPLGAKLRVSMYGFAPGYAYLSGLPDMIQVPRKPSATRGVPTGRVMIAGPQCLITTVVMPTGWSIIGRSPIEIMKDDPDNPFLFNVGDSVVFERIARDALPTEMQHP